MFEYALILILAFALGLIIKKTGDRDPSSKMLKTLMAGYLLRVVLQTFVRELPLFSHGNGGDYIQYQTHASAIVTYWERFGFTYVTDNDLPGLGATTLPQNLFAVVEYLNGGPARFGNTALVAFLSTLACLNLYRFAVEVGADPAIAFRTMAILYFSPAYFFYSADMFKDGIVAFLIVSALYASFQLAHRFTIVGTVTVVVYLIALWSVRFYLVFLAVLPVFVGFVGASSKSLMRPVLMVVGIAIVLVAVGRATSSLDTFVERADSTFETATSQNAREYNAKTGGSGVEFDDGGNPFGKLYLKIPYTVFSPFPWQFGSFGFNIGKIDAGLFAYFIYRAYLASRELLKRDRTLVLMFLVFLLPLTLAYATTMANIGLIVRQRIPVVMITAVLATLSWQRAGAARGVYANATGALRALGKSRRAPRLATRPGRLTA